MKHLVQRQHTETLWVVDPEASTFSPVKVRFHEFLDLVSRNHAIQFNEAQVRHLLDVIGCEFANAAVLDVACGRKQPWLADRWREASMIVGIDISYAALVSNTDIQFPVKGDVGSLPVADHCFDFVVSKDTVEHLVDADNFFAEVARVLKPGGIFLLFTPNVLNYKNLIVKLLGPTFFNYGWQLLMGRPIDYSAYYRANRAGSIKRLANRSGLTVRGLVYLPEVSHFFWQRPVFAVGAYLWERFLLATRLTRFSGYIVAILERPTIDKATTSTP